MGCMIRWYVERSGKKSLARNGEVCADNGSQEEPSDDENDMLDLAFGLTETSRLGCQVTMSKELDGLVVKLPSMTRNLQASDFAEKK